MKNFFLTLFLLIASSCLLSAQGWVYLQLEGTPGEVAVQCADEGDDGFIYGIAEIDFDPYFVKLDADGELLATSPLPVAHYYSRFQKFANGQFLGWGHNTVTLFDATGAILWSQVFPDESVKHANRAGDKVLVLTKSAATPYHILRFLADGSPDGDVTFQTTTQCLYVGSDGASGFVAAGNYTSSPNNYQPAFLTIDNAGTVTQAIQLPGFTAASIAQVTEMPGGGYAMIGLGWSAADSGIRGHVVKVSAGFTQEWVRAIPAQFQGKYVFVSADGQLVALGQGMQDFFNMAKISLNGDLLWSRSFYKSSQSILMHGVATADSGMLLVGQLFGGIAGGVGRMLIKTDSSGLFYSHTIKGKIFADSNGDCTEQTGESELPGVRASVQKNYTEILATDDNGIFYALADTGAYTVRPLLPSTYWSLCADSVVVQVGAPDTAAVVLPLVPDVLCPRMEVSLAFFRVRPCMNTTFHIAYINTGTVPAVSATVLLEADPNLTFEDASIPLQGQQGPDGYLFAIGDVQAMGSGSFWVRMSASCDLTPGDTVCAAAHIFPDTICDPANPDTTFFRDTWCRVVTASFDPNAKSAYPPGIQAAHYIAEETPIGYVIDFQNTGTDTAFQVIIYDTLSPWLDPASIQPAVSSHPYTLERSGENVLKFKFRDILLPDSNTNEAGSHGFVKYFARPRAGVPVGTVIPNRAAIYFDFNAPIFTNEYFHTIGLPVSFVQPDPGATVGNFRLNPNPANEMLTIDVENWPSAMAEIRVQSVSGALFYRQNVALTQAGQFHLDVSAWPAGFYLVTLQSADGPGLTRKLAVARR